MKVKHEKRGRPKGSKSKLKLPVKDKEKKPYVKIEQALAEDKRELLKQTLEMFPNLQEARKDFEHIDTSLDEEINLKLKQQMINPALRNVIAGPDNRPRYLASPDKFFG